MASLVEQILAQSQAGSAGGAGFGEFYVEGKKLGQNQQRIDIAKQQLAMDIAQAPLRQTLLQQESQLNSFRLTDALQNRQNFLNSTEAFTNLSSQVAPLLSDGKLPEAQNMVLGAGLNNNFLLTDPRYKAMVTQLENMRKEADLLQYRLTLGDAAAFRAEAQMLRAGLAEEQLGLRKSQHELALEKEKRLREQFDYQVQKFEKTVPADKLAVFRERAKSIQNDLSLLSNAAERDRRLQELASELSMDSGALPAVPVAPPSTNAPPAFRIIRKSP